MPSWPIVSLWPATWTSGAPYVLPAARGRGIGGALVQAALTYARAEGRRVIPTCWYVGTWVAEHPEFRDLLITEALGSA